LIHILATIRKKIKIINGFNINDGNLIAKNNDLDEVFFLWKQHIMKLFLMERILMFY
jgi:hypothetical protein